MGACQSRKTSADSISSSLGDDVSVFFVLGGPGSGKGTQCEKISAKYNCAHISAGDLLREEVKKGTALGKQCEKVMAEGKLVPIETTLSLLEKAMVASSQKSFLIDGFPRALEQASRFESEVKSCTAVLFFECSESVMTERILQRGQTSGRVDDTEEAIKKRLETFQQISKPVADFYEAQGKCHRISAEQSPEVVFQNVEAILDQYLLSGKSTDAEPLTPKVAELKPESEPVAAQEPEPEPEPVTQPEPEQEKKEEIENSAPQEAELKSEGHLNGRVIFILGGPGSGKGTQCEKIIAEFGSKHISVGDVLRAEVESGSQLGSECQEIMKEGKLVPLEVTMTLLKKVISEGNAECYLIDGFPRSIEQAAKFEEEVKDCDCVLFFDCPEEVMLERMMERAKSSGRDDDNPETMKKRLETFVEVSAPVVEYFSAKNKCYKIPADRGPAEIFEDVKQALTPLFKTDSSDDKPQNKKLVILQEDYNEAFKEAMTACLGEDTWTVEWKTWSDEEEETKKAISEAAAIFWQPQSIENKNGTVEESLLSAKSNGVVLIPSWDVVSAAKDEQFVTKVTGSEISVSKEEGEKVEIRLSFNTPIEILSQAVGSEDSTVFKPDDPEFIPLVTQFLEQDLEKIRSSVGAETLLPFWSAVYHSISSTSGEETTREFVFDGLSWTAPDFSKHLQLVESFIPKLVEILP